MHLCSLGDLRAWIQAPSPHGQVVATWVEALPAGYDPASTDPAALPWLEAERTSYVVGFDRPGTMGVPALSFARTEDASEAAARVDGHVVDWGTLIDTPHHAAPAPR